MRLRFFKVSLFVLLTILGTYAFWVYRVYADAQFKRCKAETNECLVYEPRSSLKRLFFGSHYDLFLFNRYFGFEGSITSGSYRLGVISWENTKLVLQVGSKEHPVVSVDIPYIEAYATKNPFIGKYSIEYKIATTEK